MAVDGDLLPGHGPVPAHGGFTLCSPWDLGLYYGVDTELIRPAGVEGRAEVRRHLGLTIDKLIVLFSIRLSHEKHWSSCATALSCAYGRLSSKWGGWGRGGRSSASISRIGGVEICYRNASDRRVQNSSTVFGNPKP
jgi:hypothetical protein